MKGIEEKSISWSDRRAAETAEEEQGPAGREKLNWVEKGKLRWKGKSIFLARAPWVFHTDRYGYLRIRPNGAG